MSLKRLPASTVKLIGSSQVITSVSAAIKELIENSIDAGATCIDVKLENHGLEKIEVRDDGCGVSKDGAALMCQKSYTSKIERFQDLETLESYGFRGEALNALCAVGQVTITTKTEDEEIAASYKMNSNGYIIDSKPSHITKGTVVLVEGLFKNLPVRRQFLSNGRRKGEEIKKVESEIKSLAIIHPGLRFTFTHNKFLIWQKNKVTNLIQSLSQAIPSTVVRQLHLISFIDEEKNVKMEIIVPKKDCNVPVTCYGNLQEAVFIFINLRRIKHKVLEKVIQNELFQYFGHYIPNNKHPFSLVSIKLPPNFVDVNLEPNKSKVLLNDQDYLVDRIKKECIQYYCGLKYSGTPEDKLEFKLPKRKIEEDSASTNSVMVKVLKTEDGGKKSFHQSTPDERVPREEQNFDELDVSELQKDDLFQVPSSTQIKTQEINMIDSPLIDDTPLQIDNAYSIDDTSDWKISEDILDSSDLKKHFSEVPGSSNSIVKDGDSTLTDKSLNVNKISEHTLSIISNEIEENSNTPPCDDQQVALKREENISAYLSVLLGDDNDESESKQPSNQIKPNSPSSIDIDDITPSQWSKGNIFDSNSKKIEGTVELISGKLSLQTPQSNVKSSETSVSSAADPHIQESTIISNSDDLFLRTLNNEERSVTSQMGCKEMSAFTKFADEMRVKILEKKPGTSFASVAGELVNGWRKLEEEEKEKYKEIAREEAEKKKTNNKHEPLHQTILPVKVKKVFKKPKKHFSLIKEVNLSISSIKEGILSRCSKQVNPNQTKIVGKIGDDIYCYLDNNELRVVSYSRLKEIIFFYKNLSTMEIPVRLLEKNIEVTQESLGEKLWKLLLSLKTDMDLKDHSLIVADEIIRKNGLRIEVKKYNSDVSFEISDVPANISYFGVCELNEVLTLMEKNLPNHQVLDCRPLKVSSFIRSETIRMLAQMESKYEEKDFGSCFLFWLSEIKSKFSDCPHYKPVTTLLKSL